VEGCALDILDHFAQPGGVFGQTSQGDGTARRSGQYRRRCRFKLSAWPACSTKFCCGWRHRRLAPKRGGSGTRGAGSHLSRDFAAQRLRECLVKVNHACHSREVRSTSLGYVYQAFTMHPGIVIDFICLTNWETGMGASGTGDTRYQNSTADNTAVRTFMQEVAAL
jgi:hypothetical protein